MDLRKHTYIVASFDLLISAAAMILGFVVIIYPERYIRQTDLDGLTKEFINETTSEIEVAMENGANDTEVHDIQNGVIASPEQFHYIERIKDLQNEIVEG